MFNAKLCDTLSVESRAALTQAIASKGPYKGYLAKSAPSANSLAYAARQAVLMRVNTYKISISGIMFLSEEQKRVYNEVQAWVESLPLKEAIKLDKDRSELESMGVW